MRSAQAFSSAARKGSQRGAARWNIAEDRFQCGRRLFRAIEALDGKRDGVRSAHRPEVGLYIVISVHDRGRAALVPFRC